MATTPEARRQAIVDAVVEARTADADVAFVGAGTARDVVVAYEDRSLRLEVTAEEHDRLDGLLSEYHVFKVAQPATRRADDGVVWLSAVTDPKHTADFVEALFRTVYGFGEDYRLDVDHASDGAE